MGPADFVWSRFRIVHLTSIGEAGERRVELAFLLQTYSIDDLLVFGIDLVALFDTVTEKSLNILIFFRWI